MNMVTLPSGSHTLPIQPRPSWLGLGLGLGSGLGYPSCERAIGRSSVTLAQGARCWAAGGAGAGSGVGAGVREGLGLGLGLGLGEGLGALGCAWSELSPTP